MAIVTDGASTGSDREPARLVVSVEVPRDQAELVADRCFALGASAVAEHPARGAAVALVADLPAAAVAELGLAARVLEPEQAWTTGWREHARARRVGDRLLVRPPWCDAGDLGGPDVVEIVVDPGDAFGSGSHETTRSCLVELERLGASGRLTSSTRVLDVGCGSGVLGVAALLLGAGAVVAVDVDPAAVTATAAVARANGVADRLRVQGTPLADVPGRFEVVLANLLIPVIEELGPSLVDHLAAGGHLVVGGLLAEHRTRAEAALEGLEVVAVGGEGQWLTLVLRR